MGFGVRTTGVRTVGFQIPALPCTSYVTLGWFLNLPKALLPGFPKIKITQGKRLAWLWGPWKDEASMVSVHQGPQLSNRDRQW